MEISMLSKAWCQPVQGRKLRSAPVDLKRQACRNQANAFATRLEAIAARSKKLLGTKGIAIRSKDASGAPGLTTRSKKLLGTSNASIPSASVQLVARVGAQVQ